ncbi:MAG: FHA domain-containing protein [Synechococcales bacterium]|nr:FHA domain-containing protein [Synechococcales bacterium]
MTQAATFHHLTDYTLTFETDGEVFMNLDSSAAHLMFSPDELDQIFSTPAQEGQGNLPLSNPLKAALSQMPVAELDQALDQEEDEEDEGYSDEMLSNRVETYVMSLDDELDSYDVQCFTSKPSPYYVQGVIRGQQAYLITNLLGEGSKTLLQPQMVWTFGRNREAAVPLKDRMMSRRHSVILFNRHEGFQFLDLNSMNGSYLNGVRVEARVNLKDGDFVRVGNTEFFFFLSGSYRSLPSLHTEVLNRILNFG